VNGPTLPKIPNRGQPLRDLLGTGKGRGTASGSTEHGKLIDTKRISKCHDIVWIVGDTATRRIEIREAVAGAVRRDEVYGRSEGATRHESIQKSGIGIAVKEDDRLAVGVTVFGVPEPPAIGQQENVSGAEVIE
jgi:hypothetical protein